MMIAFLFRHLASFRRQGLAISREADREEAEEGEEEGEEEGNEDKKDY